MRSKQPLLWILCVVVLNSPLVVHGETAAEAFAKGEALVVKGDFDAALMAYADAARGDRTNQEYLQHYAILRRVIQLRASLDAESDPARWETLARSLNAFYVSQKIQPEALALGRQMHAKLDNAWSAANLGETLLAVGLNDEAVKTLEGLGQSQKSPTTEALRGVALTRTGQTAPAKELAASISLPQDADPQAAYAVARLFAAVGDTDKAIGTLTQSLASTPPSRQPELVGLAKESPEFAAVAKTAEFEKALNTVSTIAESKCSGGKSCAGCPMRNKCPSGESK